MQPHDRRDYVINEAVRAGKFTRARGKFWRRQYDRDPVGTEAALALMASPLDGPQPYPKELFPELSRMGRRGLLPPTRRSPAAAAVTPISRVLPDSGVRSAAPQPAVGPVSHARTSDVAAGRIVRPATPPSAGHGGRPPSRVRPGERPSGADVEQWSASLGFKDAVTTGRVMKAND